ncbi:MAG: flagellar motor switch phosphatase FliY [Cyanobacteria bacterium NC_groundwater_1444_Ag_S-0.65um_54_12]|nr:flagellar motor switch phosphatase FliY [Cyanobacteria bacterium NC_groundwater_1444_Ag_S-0.65um_54_12]
MTDFILQPEELAALEEISITAMGAGATTLSILLNQQVDISSPDIRILPADHLFQLLQEPSVLVEIPIDVGNRIIIGFFFGQADTARITDLMMGGEGSPPDTIIDELRLSAISEAVNQMIGMAANALTSSYGTKVEVSPPQATIIDRPEELLLPPTFGEGPYVVISYVFLIEALIESQILQILPGAASREFINALKARSASASQQPAKPVHESAPELTSGIAQSAPPRMPQNLPSAMPPSAPASMPSGTTPSVPPIMPPGPPHETHDWPSQMPAGQPMAPQRQQPVAHPVHFGPLANQNTAIPAATSGLDLILDVPLKVTVELGRTRMQIRDVLELGKGSVVELDKLAGEPVDLLVNGKLIARGEVVVIDENFGIRVTDIVSPAERVSGFRGVGI